MANADNSFQKGSIESCKIESDAIAKNLIGDSNVRTVYVYLPPSYSTESKRKYPVVYFLHGYGDSSRSFADITRRELDAVFQEERKEFIVVILDGNNKTGGSFYVNSPSSGNWEDYIADELVEYIDTTYRTIPKSASRCITGYSMGGYGAISIAFNRPQVFGSVMVFCPGIYADGDIKSMWDSWRGWEYCKLSYAQAFAPTNDSEKRFGNIPSFSNTEEDNRIVAQWDRGYGCWEEKAVEFKAGKIKLRGIEIDYGTNDSFVWIPKGCKFFSEVLNKNGIKHEIKEFGGGHVVPDNCYKEYFIPFVKKYVKFR